MSGTMKGKGARERTGEGSGQAETTSITIPIDFTAYSDDVLLVTIDAIQLEIARRKEARTQEAIEKMREIASSVGMTPEELLGLGGGEKPKAKRGRRGAIAWRHPDDPSLVYRGGKKPSWLVELEGQGRAAVKVE